MEHEILTMIFLVSLLFHSTPLSTSTNTDTLLQGKSLLVTRAKTDVLVSPNSLYSAGFFHVGENSFSFSVWFSKSREPTVVWTANRDQPLNDHGSKVSLTDKGDLVLLNAGTVVIWSTETSMLSSLSTVKLKLNNNGNLVLVRSSSSRNNRTVIWESFNSPTDTLLPRQELTVDRSLVSSKSTTNYSSGYYRLFYDVDNVLKLLFQGPYHKISSVYWPTPWRKNFENGRSTYNNSRMAFTNDDGFFSSSDNLVFASSDYGEKRYRRLTLDPDGNLRLYSFNEENLSWVVTWQALLKPCNVHGICGPNSFCTYDHTRGRRCNCAQGFKMTNSMDWFYGCEPEFRWENYTRDVTGFFRVQNAEFYGNDRNYFPNRTLRECKEECLKLPECQGFQFNFNGSVYNCYHKAQLLNGHHTTGFRGDVYIRVPKASLPSYDTPSRAFELKCPAQPQLLSTVSENGTLKVLVWVSVGFAAMEIFIIAVILGFLYLSRKDQHNKRTQNWILATATRFQEFTYAELRIATRGFREEVGSGSAGTVYKGTLPDGRVAAIKRLREAEFSSVEAGTIGRLHHMNLIEMWGYCAEGKHRLLVYEYMKHGSLSDNLSSNALSWEKRFEIVLGTAKGLAYLHEECLEWVLHCDVKPENILLGSDYKPKVADFGLSKMQDRGGETKNSSFSRIRGTRGYMAPEWVYNLPITSKVDVYSYGIVVLEVVTGRKPTGVQMVGGITGEGAAEHGRLVTWVREKASNSNSNSNGSKDWVNEIADPVLEGKYEVEKMEVVVKVALQCVEEDREARPTMRQVVEMLQYTDDQRSIMFG